MLAPFIILKMKIKKIHISREPQILVRLLKIITKMVKAKNHIIAYFKSQISSYCWVLGLGVLFILFSFYIYIFLFYNSLLPLW